MQFKKLFNENVIKVAAAVVTIYFLILTIVLLSGFFSQFTWLVTSLVLGVIIALIIKPIKETFVISGFPKTLSIIFGYIVFSAIIAVVFFLLLPPLIEELNTFLGGGVRQIKENFPSLDPINNFLKQFNSSASISADEFTKPLTQNIGELLSNIGSIATNMVGLLIQFILGLIFSIFIITDGRKFSKNLLKLTPKGFKDDYKIIANALIDGFRSFIKIQGLSALAYAILVMIIMKVMGFDYILICGVLSFLAFLIPGIGAPIALLPPLVSGLLFKSNQIGLVIVLMIILLIIQNVMLNVLIPRLYGKTLGIHPALVLIVILVSLQLFGILGVILAVPVASALQQVITNFLNNERMQKSTV